jgi:phytol kinase
LSFESLNLVPDRHEWMRPWLFIGGFLSAARVLLAVVCFHSRRFKPPAELSRKCLHVGMGTLFLTCPWLFDEAWPVFVLAGIFIGLLLARHLLPPLNYHVAGVIYGVRRESAGEYYLPVAAALLFAVTGRNPLLYCVPLSLLVYADAAAAVVGRRYGQWRYGDKSVEGSVAFAVVAFVCAHVLIGLLDPHSGRATALLVAMNVAVVTTVLEAFASRGLDNLTVPLVGFLGLRVGLATSTGHLVAMLIAQVLILCARGSWLYLRKCPSPVTTHL